MTAASVAATVSATHLAQAIAAVAPQWRLRVNRNATTLLSLRGTAHQATVSVHEDLLTNPDFVAALPRWIARGGRSRCPLIERALRQVQDRLVAQQSAMERAALPPWEPLRGPLDLAAMATRIHRDWFAHTPYPQVEWSRAVAPGRQLTHIRFGAYFHGARPRITLHPRVNQPWVARMFAEHILFHEFCHHAQACRPIRGETPHSPRFRTWERRYPHHELAQAWERAYLRDVLAGTVPRESGEE